MVYVFLAEGFEEMEALCPVDILRRGGHGVFTVAIGKQYNEDKHVKGGTGIVVECDVTEQEVDMSQAEMIVLPGGLEGTANLKASAMVQQSIDYAVEHKIWIAAICAAPSILGAKGLLKGKRAVAYPTFWHTLTGARIVDDGVVVDGLLVTARAAGSSVAFGLTLAEVLSDKIQAADIARLMYFTEPCVR